MLHERPQRYLWPLFAGVIVLAAWLRLSRLDLIDLRYDEAVAPVFAREIAHGASFAFVPHSGSLIAHPPLWIYALSAPYFFTDNFYAVVGWRVSWDVIAVAVLMLACGRAANMRSALIAGLLFACAPWMVWYGRKMWTAPSVLLAAFTFWGLVEGWVKKQSSGWWLAGIATMLNMGTHLAAGYALAPVALLAFISARSQGGRVLIASLGPAVLAGAIYITLDATSGLQNINRLWDVARASQSDLQSNFDAFTFALWMTGGQHISDLTGPSYPLWLGQSIQAFAAIDFVQMGLVIASIVFALAQFFVRSRAVPLAAVALSWLLLPLVLHLRHAGPMQPQYPAIFVMGAFALVALLLDAAFARASRWIGAFAVVALCVICGWHIASVLRFNDFVDRNETWMQPARPFLAAAGAARAALCKGNHCAGRVIVVASGDDPHTQGEPATWQFLLAGTPHQFSASERLLRIPSGPSAFVAQTSVISNARMMALAKAHVRVTDERVWGNVSFAATQAIASELPSNVQRPMWEMGAGLDSLLATRAENAVLVTATLTSGEVSPNEMISFSAQLFVDETKLVQQDALIFDPATWSENELVYVAFPPLTLPTSATEAAQKLTVRLSAYRTNAGATMGVRQPDGNWTGYVLAKVAR